MSSYNVLSVVGTDRPGIVQEISAIVAEDGCNIDDSRMAHLGGDFAVIMLLSGEKSPLQKVVEKIRAWAEKESMTIVVRPTAAPGKGADEPASEIDIEMPDHPGIVSRITAYLAERGANVEKLETSVTTAPFTGATLFSMHVVASGLGEIPPEELRRALQDLPGNEAVEITLGN